MLDKANGLITSRFHARDLNLLLAPPGEMPGRFRVRLDDCLRAAPTASMSTTTAMAPFHEPRAAKI